MNVLEYFYLKQELKVPSHLKKFRKVKYEAAKPYPKGPCFILNLDDLLEDNNDLNHIYTYLELASKRNVFDYLMRGVDYLPLALVPEYLLGLIETNPLLEVYNGNVYFKYE